MEGRMRCGGVDGVARVVVVSSEKVSLSFLPTKPSARRQALVPTLFALESSALRLSIQTSRLFHMLYPDQIHGRELQLRDLNLWKFFRIGDQFMARVRGGNIEEIGWIYAPDAGQMNSMGAIGVVMLVENDPRSLRNGVVHIAIAGGNSAMASLDTLSYRDQIKCGREIGDALVPSDRIYIEKFCRELVNGTRKVEIMRIIDGLKFGTKGVFCFGEHEANYFRDSLATSTAIRISQQPVQAEMPAQPSTLSDSDHDTSASDIGIIGKIDRRTGIIWSLKHGRVLFSGDACREALAHFGLSRDTSFLALFQCGQYVRYRGVSKSNSPGCAYSASYVNVFEGDTVPGFGIDGAKLVLTTAVVKEVRSSRIGTMHVPSRSEFGDICFSKSEHPGYLPSIATVFKPGDRHRVLMTVERNITNNCNEYRVLAFVDLQHEFQNANQPNACLSSNVRDNFWNCLGAQGLAYVGLLTDNTAVLYSKRHGSVLCRKSGNPWKQRVAQSFSEVMRCGQVVRFSADRMEEAKYGCSLMATRLKESSETLILGRSEGIFETQGTISQLSEHLGLLKSREGVFLFTLFCYPVKIQALSEVFAIGERLHAILVRRPLEPSILSKMPSDWSSDENFQVLCFPEVQVKFERREICVPILPRKNCSNGTRSERLNACGNTALNDRVSVQPVRLKPPIVAAVASTEDPCSSGTICSRLSGSKALPTRADSKSPQLPTAGQSGQSSLMDCQTNMHVLVSGNSEPTTSGTFVENSNAMFNGPSVQHSSEPAHAGGPSQSCSNCSLLDRILVSVIKDTSVVEKLVSDPDCGGDLMCELLKRFPEPMNLILDNMLNSSQVL